MLKYLSRLRVLLPLVPAAFAVAPALAAPVTSQRLIAAASEPGNWLTSAGDYGAHAYSGLSVLDRSNVARMKLLYTVPLGDVSAGNVFESMRISAPLVVDGILYTADAFGAVYSFDVSQGPPRQLWKAEPAAGDMNKWLQAQWSLTLAGDSIVLAAADGALFWIDRASGEVTRSAQVGHPASGYALVAPPLLVGDNLVIAGAGGDRGAVPQIDAISASTGEPVWHVVPQPLGNGAWQAGGSFLRAGVFDPETNLIVWSTSNPLPQNEGDEAAGGLGNALVAVDATTGAVAWTRKYLETDTAGFDEAATPLLTDNGLVHAADNGYFYRVDLRTGALKGAEPFVTGLPSWAATLDANGVPLSVAADVPTAPGCPNIIAEPNMPSSYSLRTGLVYAAENNGCRDDIDQIGSLQGLDEGGEYAFKTVTTGALAAIDPETGKRRAERRFDFPLQSGLVSTAGGLVFVATADGVLHAVDDETLEPLWTYPVSSFVASPPITFSAGGAQYLAVLAGGGPLLSKLSFIPRGSSGVRHVTVLAIFGVEP